MPTYDYSCETCGAIWDEIHKIADRKEPESHACPKCGQGPVKQGTFVAPSLGDPVRLGFIRPNSGVREALQRVQEKSPNATVKDHSTFARI